jgi:hypothetical protein
MGHRTLVAYDRTGYDLHYAHWGVDPAELTPETPFGSPPDDEWARRRAGEIVDPAGGRLPERGETAVDPEPLARELSFQELCARVDPIEHEALYVVSEDRSVRRYLVFGLREEAGRHEPPTTALVGYESEADAAYLRGWLAGARAVRDGGDHDEGGVVRALRWLDPDRGVVVYPGGEREN